MNNMVYSAVVPATVGAMDVRSYKALDKKTETYTVRWVNYDGTLLQEDTDIAAGSMPSYKGKAPAREADAKYTYTFAGWNPEIVSVTKDVTYTAQFTAKEIPSQPTTTVQATTAGQQETSQAATTQPATTKLQPTTTAQVTTTAQATTKPQPTTAAQATTTAQTDSDSTDNSDDNNDADDSAKADNAADSTAASGSLNVSGINATVSVKNGTVIKNAAGVAVNSGNVYLRAIPKTAGQSEADRIRQAVANQNVDLGDMQLVYYEVELVDAFGNPLTFDGNITVTFAYPEGTDAQTYTFKVLHLLKSGVLDVMDPYVTSEGLSVEVSELSPFAIAYKEAAQEVVQTGENVSSSQTVDRAPVVILMVLIAVSVAVLLGITYSSKNRKSER